MNALTVLVTLTPLSNRLLAGRPRNWEGSRAFRSLRALLNPQDIRDCHGEPEEIELFGAALLLGLPDPLNEDLAAHIQVRADHLLAHQLDDGRHTEIDLRICRLRNALAAYVRACKAMRNERDAERAALGHEAASLIIRARAARQGRTG